MGNKNPTTRDGREAYNRFQLQRRKRTLMMGFLFTTICDHTLKQALGVRSFLLSCIFSIAKIDLI